MADRDYKDQEDIFSKVVRAGRRTYFFDVRSTKADDYYLTITESKKFTNDDGSFHFKKHKIYLYKEDFAEFESTLAEMTQYIIKEKGDEVISERHQADYDPAAHAPKETPTSSDNEESKKSFTDISFDDI
ncbi:PUR family DNA/RNA-binding protein [Nonlabens sp.]|uniref:PUR family DNA/RNA-binding protein n=1 Tax=Nonlabens sp. TaxID=1888209 RepID=UPI003F69FDD2